MLALHQTLFITIVSATFCVKLPDFTSVPLCATIFYFHCIDLPGPSLFALRSLIITSTQSIKIANMDIDQQIFYPRLLGILENISHAKFISLDVEMSGIFMPKTDRNRPGNGRPGLEELYQDMKAAAEKYQILQVGITCVLEDHQRSEYTSLAYCGPDFLAICADFDLLRSTIDGSDDCCIPRDSSRGILTTEQRPMSPRHITLMSVPCFCLG